MNINIWTMWNDEREYSDWRNGDTPSEYETIATVDNDTIRLEYEYCDGKIVVYESELNDDEETYSTIDEYIDSRIITQNHTLHDVLNFLVTEISGI